MKNIEAAIKSQRRLAEGTYEMVLSIDAGDVRAGQFINIRIDGFYLRRPISVCDWTKDTLTIIYKTVGRGTEQMSRMREGEKLDVLCPLGNSYKPGSSCVPLLIGGGAGAPPMYGLCKQLTESGAHPTVILGFRNKEEVFYKKKFEDLGVRVIITTEDGSEGVRGFVTDAMEHVEYDAIYACGPEPMLKAVDDKAPKEIPGQLSFERRMGCGFGACMGCSCRTRYGSKRICVEGPVLERSEIVW